MADGDIWGAQTPAASFTPDVPGPYILRLTVSDGQFQDGDNVMLSAINAQGVVTGGGWIQAPAGSVPWDGALSGKASFGFVVAYRDGHYAPSGEMQFQFRPADLNLHAKTFHWLTVSGGYVQFAVAATINGEEGYEFLATLVDGKIAGGTDSLRMKVWNAATGETVFDSEPGENEASEPHLEVQGGSIVIHK